MSSSIQTKGGSMSTGAAGVAGELLMNVIPQIAGSFISNWLESHDKTTKEQGGASKEQGGAGNQQDGIFSTIGQVGGSLLGAEFGPVGSMVAGFIGKKVGGALDNMLQDAAGNSAKDAAKELQQEHGMPKFVEQMVRQAVDDRLAERGYADASPEARRQAQDQFGKQVDQCRDDTRDGLVQNTLDELKNSGTQDADGNYSTDSWLVALAKAMGKTLGEKTSRLVELNKQANAKAQGGDSQQAGQQSQAMSELQGVSQEVKMLQETISTVLKGIGDTLSGLAKR